MARKQSTPKQTPAPAPVAAAPVAAPAAPVAPAAAPAPVAANPAQVLAQALLARAAAPTVGTLPQAPAPAAQAAAVALRGGLAVVAVAPGKPYRVQAGHNLQWLQQVQAAWAAGGGTATVQALLAAGVPAPFVGYMVRRGYAVAVTPTK